MPDPRIHADDPEPAQGQQAFSTARRKLDRRRQGPARIALAHDWLVARRGGEAVLERIAQYVARYHEPVALLTMFDNGTPIGDTVDRMPHIVARSGRLPMANRFRRWMAPCYPGMVRDLSHSAAAQYQDTPLDLLISTSSGMIKNLQPPPNVPHLCYCHTPARWLYERSDEYHHGGLGAPLRRLGLGMFGSRLRSFDRSGSRFVSIFIANSNYTRSLIEELYNRDATVVPPPVRTQFFEPDPQTRREDFWLLVSALEPYKRVDLAIEAAAKARQRLIIAGEGSLKSHLTAHARTMARRQMGGAKDLISFVGRVDDNQLLSLYRRAALFLFPQVEDFGITAVEAQACGCAVLARAEGGALDTVIPGKTGAFFDAPDPDAIVEAAKSVHSDPQACRASAKRFSEEFFDQRIGMQIESMLQTQSTV